MRCSSRITYNLAGNADGLVENPSVHSWVNSGLARSPLRLSPLTGPRLRGVAASHAQRSRLSIRRAASRCRLGPATPARHSQHLMACWSPQVHDRLSRAERGCKRLSSHRIPPSSSALKHSHVLGRRGTISANIGSYSAARPAFDSLVARRVGKRTDSSAAQYRQLTNAV